MNASRTGEAALVLALAAAVGLALWAGRQDAARGPDSDLRVSAYGTGPAGQPRLVRRDAPAGMVR